MAATLVQGNCWKLAAAGDTIPGRVLVSVIMCKVGATPGATVINVNGSGGEPIIAHSFVGQANTTQFLHQPAAPTDMTDLYLATQTNTPVIYVYMA
jgi:hypothetical protein